MCFIVSTGTIATQITNTVERNFGKILRNTISSEIEGAATVRRDFDTVEIPVAERSELDGLQLSGGGVEDSAARHVIGVLSRGQFHTPPFEGVLLDRQIRLVDREPGALERFEALL